MVAFSTVLMFDFNTDIQLIIFYQKLEKMIQIYYFVNFLEIDLLYYGKRRQK